MKSYPGWMHHWSPQQKTRKRCIWTFGFYPTLDSSWLRVHNLLWILGGKLEACFWFSRSYGVKWHLMGRCGEIFGSFHLTLLPLLLMLDIHKVCLEGDCKPKIACIWVRSGTQNRSAGKWQPPPAQPWGFQHSHSCVCTYMMQWCPKQQM